MSNNQMVSYQTLCAHRPPPFTRRPPANLQRAIVQSTNQQRPSSVGKQTMSNARQRREKENKMFEELGALLPFASAITMQLDKASIVRLTCAYIKLITMFPTGVRMLPSSVVDPRAISHEHLPIGHMATSLIMAIEGFIIYVAADGTIMYVSEGASVHVGMSQFELIGNPIAEFVHDDDLPALQTAMNTGRHCHHGEHNVYHQPPGMGCLHQHSLSVHFRMRCVLAKRNAGLVDGGYKAVHCTGYSYVRQTVQGRFEHVALMLHAVTLPPYQITEMRVADDMFVFRTDLALKLIYIDLQGAALTGLDLNELHGRSLYSLVHVDDSMSLRHTHKTALQTHQSTSMYHRWTNVSGGQTWVQTSFFLMHMPRASRTEMIVGVATILGPERPDQSTSIYDSRTYSTQTINPTRFQQLTDVQSNF